MVKISFDGQEIAVPEAWKDIRLGDYERWMLRNPTNKVEQVELVADICGIDAGVLLNNPTQLFDVVAEIIRFVFQDFDGDVSNSILIDGVDYRIANTDELTLAEWVDIESVLANESNDRLSDILSILCRPAAEVYDSKKAEMRKEMFSKLTMDRVLPLLAFFLHQRKKYQTVLNLYSEAEEEVNRYLQLIHSLAESGDGIKSLPIWQRIKYGYWTRSLKKQLSKCSDFYSTGLIKDMRKMSKASLHLN